MQGEPSDYAALGLAPGADRAAIEQAFRTLIKQYHPDRQGGDPDRTVEITRAYRRLTARPAMRDDLEFNVRPPDRGIPAVWQIAGLLFAIALLLFAMLAGPVDAGFGERLARATAPALGTNGRDRAIDPTAIAARIDDRAVAAAADAAMRDWKRMDEVALSRVSADCHAALRRDPSIDGFDRCVAYDNAVILLQDRDPMRDNGPFGEVAVVRRHWTEAGMFSRDTWAIDGRLDRLKLMVELQVAPRLPPPTVPAEPMTDQRAVDPSGASVEDVPSSDNDQRRLSDVSNFSE